MYNTVWIKGCHIPAIMLNEINLNLRTAALLVQLQILKEILTIQSWSSSYF